MKKLITVIMVLISLGVLAQSKDDKDPSTWNSKKLEKWFNEKEWRCGWKIAPDPSVNKREVAVSFFKNKDRWEKAFNFLKNNDLSKLELKRYDIDGDNLYATVSEYMSKNEDSTLFEAHRKYIDIQYVVSGKEIISIVPLASENVIITPYDAARDIEFMKYSNVVNFKATPSEFFIFFPGDAHRPGLRDEQSAPVRKIVIKMKVD
jgi:YhcH/YjgK/YiaL family protein